MKSEVYKLKISTQNELITQILNYAALIKEYEFVLRQHNIFRNILKSALILIVEFLNFVRK